MNKNKLALGALTLLAGFSLIGCGSDDVVELPTPDTVTHATSAGGNDAESMIAALSATGDERAWVFGLRDDIVVDGELHIDGYALKHSGGAWTEDTFERKVGFYIRDEVDGQARIPVGAFTLTVNEGIFVGAKNAYFLSDGPFLGQVNADVYVNAENFGLHGVQVNGDVIFATQELLDTAVAFMWDSAAAEILEGDGGDIVLYRSNSGWVAVDFASMVNGEVRVAE